MAKKTYAVLKTTVLQLLGIPGSGDTIVQNRIFSAADLAIQDFAKLQLRYYRVDTDIVLPAAQAITFTRDSAVKISSVSPAPTQYQHRLGHILIGTVWHTIQGINSTNIWLTPNIAAGAAAGTLYSSGFYFGCDHGIPLFVEGATTPTTSWELQELLGIESYERLNPAEFSTYWKEYSANPTKFWTQTANGFMIAQSPSAETELHVMLVRRPIKLASYDGTALIDFPDQWYDALCRRTVYNYLMFADAPISAALDSAVFSDADNVRNGEAQLISDVFKDIPRVRGYNKRRL